MSVRCLKRDLSAKKEVKIGQQVWMVENLNVDKFRNGDPIPEAKTNEEWEKAADYHQAAWCYYNNDPYNGTKYGKLYNWYAVNDPRGLAPEGWHIPSDQEWTDLTVYLGGEAQAGAKMKSKGGWSYGGNGTNSSGFNAFPGGERIFGRFTDIVSLGFWWSSTEYFEAEAWYRLLDSENGYVYTGNRFKEMGFSVRCLRDSR